MDFLSGLMGQSQIPQLEPAQVQALLSQSPSPFLLDVRTPEEYGEEHISGTVLIPLDNLAARINRIPKDKDIICICASGSRSSAAANFLSSRGYKVSNMRGGMHRWVHSGLPIKTGSAK